MVRSVLDSAHVEDITFTCPLCGEETPLIINIDDFYYRSGDTIIVLSVECSNCRDTIWVEDLYI